jgi:hypothetical protein
MSNVQSRLETAKREGYNFRIGDFISQGFTIFGKNAAMFIGFLLVSIVISIVLRFIPLLGQLVSFVISGALGAGYFIVAHQTFKNEHTEFSNFFDGFKDWVQLFLNSLIVTFMIVLGLLPAIVFFIKSYGLDLSSIDLQDPEAISDLIKGFGVLYIFLYFLAIILLAIFIIYSALFIVFDKMNAWDAIVASAKIVSQNIFSHIIFFMAWIFIFIISAIPIGLGLLVTVPAFYCSIYYAWQEITRYNDDREIDDDLLNHLIE